MIETKRKPKSNQNILNCKSFSQEPVLSVQFWDYVHVDICNVDMMLGSFGNDMVSHGVQCQWIRLVNFSVQANVSYINVEHLHLCAV